MTGQIRSAARITHDRRSPHSRRILALVFQRDQIVILLLGMPLSIRYVIGMVRIMRLTIRIATKRLENMILAFHHWRIALKLQMQVI